MFLRSQLLSRLPIALLRLSCNSAPSTSISFLSTASFVPSLGHLSHVTSSQQLARHFGASLVWIRGGGGKDCQEMKGVRSKHIDDSSSSSNNKGGQDYNWADNEDYKFISYSFSISFIAMVLLMALNAMYAVNEGRDFPEDAEEIDFDTFAEKYLKAGKIQKVEFFSKRNKAVAILRPEAIIDGKPAESRRIVITPRLLPDDLACWMCEFIKDVGKEEKEMGIDGREKVNMVPRPPFGFPVSPLVLCLTLWLLFTKSGRLVTRKMSMRILEKMTTLGRAKQ